MIKKFISMLLVSSMVLFVMIVLPTNFALASNGISSDGLTITAGELTINLSSTGVITCLTDNVNNINHSLTTSQRSLICLYLYNNSTSTGSVVTPNSMSYSNGNYTFGFSQGVTAIVHAVVKNSYANFELTSLANNSGLDLQYFIWGPVAVNIKGSIADTLGVVYDNNYAIGIMGLNIKTIASLPPDIPSITTMDNWTDVLNGYAESAAIPVAGGGELRAFTADYTVARTKQETYFGTTYQKYDIPALDPNICGTDGQIVGSKIAIYGCATSEVLSVISNMEVAEGLPHPTINGVWAKDPKNLYSVNQSEYLFGVFQSSDINQRIYDGRRMGANLLYGHDTFQNYNGDYRFQGFSSYSAFKTAITDVAAAQDMLVGTKNRPAMLAYTVPNANSATNIEKYIVRQRATTLTANITANYTGNISLADTADFTGTCYLLIGDEVIKTSGMSIQARGCQGTTASAHNSGDAVYLLHWLTDGETVLKFTGNQQLIHDAMNTIADSVNTAGLSLSDMDGLEVSQQTGNWDYMVNKTMDLWYNALNSHDNIRNFSSAMTQWTWHTLTNLTWGEKYSDPTTESEYNYRLGKCYDYYTRNFFPASYGLCGNTSSFTVNDANFIASKAAAFNTNIVISDEGMNSSIKNDLFDTYREWMMAKDVNAFTLGQRIRMAPYSSHWSLTTVEPGIEWNLKTLALNGTNWNIVASETAKAPGITNLATTSGVTITGSTSITNVGEINNKSLNSSSYATVGTGPQYIKIDLGQSKDIDQIRLWHYYDDGRKYKDVEIQLSNDPNFQSSVTTVFNNDTNNSLGLGTGTDKEYSETFTGKTIEFNTVNARYVRIWSNGSNVDTTNHYCEVQVINGKRTYAGILQRVYRNLTTTNCNIAAGNGVVASSGTGTVANITDGNYQTVWESALSDNEWAYVKLDGLVDIGKIYVTWGNSNAQHFKVQISQDEQTWTDVYEETNGNGQTIKLSFDNPRSANYVRILGIQRANGNLPYSIAEIAVSVSKEMNITENVIPTFSSAITGEASAATDGDFDNSRRVDTAAGAQWMKLDLGQSYNLDKLKVWHYYADGRTYHDVILQLSNDPNFNSGVTTVYNNDTNNSAGQGIGSDSEYAETSSGKEVTFSPVNARYVRFWTNGNTVSQVGNYVEVQVYDSADSVTPAPIIVDNGDQGYSESGAWYDSGLTGYNGSSTRYTDAVGASAQWTPNLTAGTYTVYIYKVVNASSDSNAKIDVAYNGGTYTQYLDYTSGSSGWVKLGTFNFASGTGGYVKNTHNSGGTAYGRADAVQFVSGTIVDNGDQGYFESGTWYDSGLTGYNGSSTRYTDAVGASAQWTPNLTAGTYTVYIYKVVNASSDSNSKIDVVYNGGTYTQYLDYTSGSSGWVKLGTFNFASGTGGYVKNTHNAGGTAYGRADAVQFVFGTIVDNGDQSYSESGTWQDSGLTGYNGSSTKYTDAVGAYAKWNPNLTAGTYTVYIYKAVNANSDSNAKIDVVYNGGTCTQYVDYTSGSSGWAKLGTFNFASGTGGYVKNTHNSGGTAYGRADAVLFVLN